MGLSSTPSAEDESICDCMAPMLRSLRVKVRAKNRQVYVEQELHSNSVISECIECRNSAVITPRAMIPRARVSAMIDAGEDEMR